MIILWVYSIRSKKLKIFELMSWFLDSETEDRIFDILFVIIIKLENIFNDISNLTRISTDEEEFMKKINF